MRLSVFSQILAIGSLASFSRWIWHLTMPCLAEEPDCQGKKISSCPGHLHPPNWYGASLTAWWIFSQETVWCWICSTGSPNTGSIIIIIIIKAQEIIIYLIPLPFFTSLPKHQCLICNFLPQQPSNKTPDVLVLFNRNVHLASSPDTRKTGSLLQFHCKRKCYHSAWLQSQNNQHLNILIHNVHSWKASQLS